MELIVDLHLHSHYSRATSPQMNTEDLYFWGKIKGINVLGTGDFTHPQYFSELREKLEPAEPGLFKLKDKYSKEKDAGLPKNLRSQLFRFVLTVEISNIYSKNGRVRKMHNLIVAPSLEIAAELNERLARIGNLKADGRPILGLDSKELLRICLEISKDIVFIPAHIWTPWFSLFGSKSGFDTIKEAFEDLTPEIRIVETGLSSDPFMNWRLSPLAGLTLISNSDAHSPNKLGREANVLNTELHYQSITGTLKSNDRGFLGTIEFFPEEGRYHYDGHRLCKTCFSPAETKKLQGICPQCGKPLVIGVDYRVEELADRAGDYKPVQHKQVEYIIPLVEILAEIQGVKSGNATSVKKNYQKIIAALGSEFAILRSIPVNAIKDAGFTELAEAITRMRKGDVHVQPGYDGVYGQIKLFNNSSAVVKSIAGQFNIGL